MKQKKNEGRFNGAAGAHDKSARPADGASANTAANTARQNGAAAKERSTKSKVGSILDITVDKMRALADTGLVVGDKIVVSDDITLFPAFPADLPRAEAIFPPKNPLPAYPSAGRAAAD